MSSTRITLAQLIQQDPDLRTDAERLKSVLTQTNRLISRKELGGLLAAVELQLTAIPLYAMAGAYTRDQMLDHLVTMVRVLQAERGIAESAARSVAETWSHVLGYPPLRLEVQPIVEFAPSSGSPAAENPEGASAADLLGTGESPAVAPATDGATKEEGEAPGPPEPPAEAQEVEPSAAEPEQVAQPAARLIGVEREPSPLPPGMVPPPAPIRPRGQQRPGLAPGMVPPPAPGRVAQAAPPPAPQVTPVQGLPPAAHSRGLSPVLIVLACVMLFIIGSLVINSTPPSVPAGSTPAPADSAAAPATTTTVATATSTTSIPTLATPTVAPTASPGPVAPQISYAPTSRQMAVLQEIRRKQLAVMRLYAPPSGTTATLPRITYSSYTLEMDELRATCYGTPNSDEEARLLCEISSDAILTPLIGLLEEPRAVQQVLTYLAMRDAVSSAAAHYSGDSSVWTTLERRLRIVSAGYVAALQRNGSWKNFAFFEQLNCPLHPSTLTAVQTATYDFRRATFPGVVPTPYPFPASNATPVTTAPAVASLATSVTAVSTIDTSRTSSTVLSTDTLQLRGIRDRQRANMTTKYQLNSTPSQWVNGGFEFTAYQLTSQETELVASSTPSSADYQLRCEIVADALLSALLPKYNSSYDRQTIAVYVRLRDSIREARIPVDHAAWQTLEPRLRTTLMAFLRVYSPSTSSGRDPFLAQDSLLHPDTVSTIRIACEQFRGLAGLPQVTASAAPPISGPTPAAKSGATSRGNRDRKP